MIETAAAHSLTPKMDLEYLAKMAEEQVGDKENKFSC